jgi:hypothetical protein
MPGYRNLTVMPGFCRFASVSPTFQIATAEKNVEEKAKYHGRTQIQNSNSNGRAQIQIQIEDAVSSRFAVPSRFPRLSVGTYGADSV